MKSSKILMRQQLFLLLLSSALHSTAQVKINYKFNAPRECDTIARLETGYLPAGAAGEDVVWDVSDNITISDTIRVYCYTDSTSSLICMEPDKMLKFRLSEDSLLLTGYETRLRRMDYPSPVCLTVFPSYYGDIHGGEFHGSGMYCDRLAIETEGNYSLEIDGAGSLCLTSGDTIRNVLRLHFLKSGSVWMHEPDDSTEISPSKRRQEIEERYLWYAWGYRYPLMESKSVSYYDNLTLVSDKKSSYVSLPEWMRCLNDSVNHAIQTADSLSHLSQNQVPIINYTMHLSPSGQLHLTYNLLAQANITFLVCNAMGITYMSTTVRKEAGDGYSTDFDCSGLNHGTYLLYINCNGQVYSETFQR